MHIDYLCNHPGFIEELATLNFKEWGDFAPGDSIEARIELMRSACGKGEIPSVVVALEGAELLGGALLIDSDLDLRPELTPWLAGVYVKAEHRGKGVASQLVNRVLKKQRRWACLSYIFTPTLRSHCMRDWAGK
ncbi:GNAT family N-acetyltransferase [Pseudomonas sp. S3_G06]